VYTYNLKLTFTAETTVVTCSGGVSLKKILEQHEKSCLQETFVHTSYTCSICMEEKKGESCTQLSRCGVSEVKQMGLHGSCIDNHHYYSMSFAKSV
jgi:glucose dehydrogenase